MKRNSFCFTLISLAFLFAILSVAFNNLCASVYAEESLTSTERSPDHSKSKSEKSKSETNNAIQEISAHFPVFGKTSGNRWSMTHRGVEFHFRWCSSGSFVMGSPENEKDRYKNEIQHKVTLTRGFWILETEVTQKMFQSVTGKNPSEFRGDQKPVDSVNWQDCVNFCQDLTRQFAQETDRDRSVNNKKMLSNDKAEKLSPVRNVENKSSAENKSLAENKSPAEKTEAALSSGRIVFTLPTEAQWEYACRAGSEGAFAGSLEKLAWFGEPNETGSTHSVGTKQPNAWGIYDMHGNLWEWCADWYRDFSKDHETDPEGPKNSDCGVRIDRGGCWDSTPDYCRCAHRGTYEPERAGRYVGFRIVVIP